KASRGRTGGRSAAPRSATTNGSKVGAAVVAGKTVERGVGLRRRVLRPNQRYRWNSTPPTRCPDRTSTTISPLYRSVDIIVVSNSQAGLFGSTKWMYALLSGSPAVHLASASASHGSSGHCSRASLTKREGSKGSSFINLTRW